MKKFVCLLLAFILVFSTTYFVVATDMPTDVTNKVVRALQGTEPIKDKIGLSKIDFSNLYIGRPVSTYNYVNGTLVKSRFYYPLFFNNQLTAFAVEIGSGEELHFQISTDLVNNIISLNIDKKTEVALIFDSVSAYLWSNNELHQLYVYPQEVYERDTISVSTKFNNNLSMQCLAPKQRLSYFSTTDTTFRVQTYYTCSNINHVTQSPYRNICWAASIACIVNARTGSSFSAVDIAQDYYGSDFNHPLLLGAEIFILNMTFDMDYVNYTYIPGDYNFLTNIQNNYPIMGTFNYVGTSLYHFCVLYAINITSGYYYVMDPASGFHTMTYSTANGYHYLRASSNELLSMVRTSSRF